MDDEFKKFVIRMNPPRVTHTSIKLGVLTLVVSRHIQLPSVLKNVSGNQLWKKSKHYSVRAYKVKSSLYDIMAEVYKNGPVEVAFSVYEEFTTITGGALGGHAVKLIGWGTSDDGEEYWLLANQWNRSWEDDGYFKIKRGTNECGIEDDITAGLPSS
ncbi:hypothetical protein TanjilG_22862 [Lupinus angustifolius]|uniref:Peptidase C1A papain C-terminal domain-containing protein n=1 Tax=Lupinus angustifolius TaxID=3871 RepID=A0A4P1RIT1_LUPAN|nr:hypothetical protein TanjilG_22862 [Lupinus angustifolius]